MIGMQKLSNLFACSLFSFDSFDCKLVFEHLTRLFVRFSYKLQAIKCSLLGAARISTEF